MAISLRSIVLPVFGWDTIIPLCPFPIGENKSITLVESVLDFPAKLNFSSGNKGVKCSKATRSLTIFGLNPFIFETRISGKYFSPSFGGRTTPLTVSPVFKPNNFICDCDK